MKHISFLQFTKRHIYLLLALVIALLAGRYLLVPHHFHTHDDIQVFRTNEFIQCFKDGQIPCRWSRNLGKGYGYPLFIFYPPAIYSLTAIIHSFGFSLITSLNLLALLTFFIAAGSIYALIHYLTKDSLSALFASLLYTLYPYHAANVFVRGVQAENLAWSFLPLLLLSLTYLIQSPKPNFWPAILTAGLFLTHNISAMIFTPLLILWSLAFLLKIPRSQRFSKLKLLILNAVLALGLASFFLLPALIEKPLVQTESMIFDYYSYLVHFVSLKQVFWSTFWGYGGSTYGVEGDGMSFMIGRPYWILFLILSFTYLWRHRRRWTQISPVFWVTFILTPFYLFLTHARSTPIYQIFPWLQYVQFPWRFIGVAGTLIVINISFLSAQLKSSLKKWFILGFSLWLLTHNLTYFRPQKFDKYQDQDFLQGRFTQEQQGAHLFDYLPKTVQHPPSHIATQAFEADSSIQLLNQPIWRSNYLELRLLNPTDQPHLVTLSIYAYPGWKLFLDNQLQSLDWNNQGLIQIQLPPGEHTLQARFQETKWRYLADFISLVSLIALLKLSL